MIIENPNRVLLEGVSISKDPPEEFFKFAEQMLDACEKKLGGLNQYKSILQKGNKPLRNNKGFARSIEKNKELIKKCRSANKGALKLNFNIHQCSVQKSQDPGPKLANVMNSFNLKLAPEQSFLKSLFVARKLYKELDEDTLILVEWNVSWLETYGVKSGYTECYVIIQCAENDEKTRKSLNFNESTEINKKNSGVFDNIRLI